MNKRIILVFASVLCLAACTKNEGRQEIVPPPHDTPSDTPDDTPSSVTYKFIVSDQKGEWEVGDRIYIHGSYAPAAVTVTLTSDDILEDKKTATAELSSDIQKYLAKPDGLYAIWPADAVEKGDGLITAKTDFVQFKTMLCMSYLKDDTFRFADVSAAIKFTVSGDYDKVIISGADFPGLRLLSFRTEYTSKNPTFTAPKDDGYPFREEPVVADGTTVNSIWFPAGVTLKGGYTLFLGKDGNYLKTYTVSQDTELKPGKIVNLGDITSQITDYSGRPPKMPQMGKCTLYSLDFQELSGICLSKDKDFLWIVGDEGHIARVGFDGKIIKGSIRDIGGDLEDVTLNPETGDLIMSSEPGSIYGLSAENNYGGSLNRLFRIEDALRYSDTNAGMEGCTYYKDGYIYCGAQTNADLYLCNLYGETYQANVGGTNYTCLRYEWKRSMYSTRLSEVGGLCYDPETNWLFIIDSEYRKFYVFDDSAQTLLGAYPVSEVANAESICVDHGNKCIWVGDDWGDTSHIYKYEFPDLDDFDVTKD